MTGIKAGSRIVARTQPIHIDAAAKGNASPASNASMQVGADSVRRRLSSIFQRPIAGTPRSARQQPRQQLPVAARPTVMAPRGDVVACGELLDYLDVGREACAGKDAFEQIVAEQCRVRHPAGKRRFESVDFVDALARIGAFADQILVHVGCGGGIRVDAVHAGKDVLEQRAFTADRQ